MRVTTRLSYWMVWGLMASGLFSPATLMAVEFANITVTDGANPASDPPAVSIAGGQGTADFFVDSGAVVGEFPIRIGASSDDDADNGVLISSVREFGREVPLATSGTEILWASTSIVRDDHPTATNTRGGTGGYSIVTDRAGTNVNPDSQFPLGAAMNANVATAYFPFSQGWVGGTAYNASGGSTYDTFVGSVGLSLSENVQQDFFTDGNGMGDNLVTIPGVEDTRRQGILLGMSAQNANHYTVVSPTADGDGFNVTNRANTQNAGDGTTGPVSFVFIPLGTPNVTMASIHGGTGSDPLQHPVPLIKSGNDFTITKELLSSAPDPVDAKYRLSIDGESPSSGVLYVQSNSNHDGDGGLPADNLITYEVDGNDWVITSDDLPNANGLGQNSGTGEEEPYFHFVFLPFNAPPTAPGPIPELKWSKRTVLAFNTTVTELDGTDNNNNDGTVGMYTETNAGTQGVEFLGLGMNKGDNFVSADGAVPTPRDGVMLATISEGLRDNSATGGLFEYGVVGVVTQSDPTVWRVVTATADPSNGEHNINFAAAVFGADTGFPMEANRAVDSNGHLDLTIPGVNSLTDGVLFVGSTIKTGER